MMRMIKNLKKKRSADKKGVILVTVLFILAMAMIFISCALLLTSASRSRVYEKTQSTQARLTLTSAIESFYQALSMQEISDAALEAYADFGADMQVLMDDNTIPGMYPAGPGGSDNCTRAKFARTTLNGKDYIVVDFTTIIGAKVDGDGNPLHNPDGTIKYNQENARLFLYETTTPDPPDLFSSQVDYNGPLGNNFRGTIGKHNFGTNPEDNLIVWRGNYRANQSENTKYWSDLLFIGDGGATEKYASFELDNEEYYGDLIFLDNYKFDWGKSTQPKISGDVYFLGPSGKTGSFTTTSEPVGQAGRSYGKAGSTWVFANRTINAPSGKDNVFGAVKNTDATLLLKSPNGGWDSSMGNDLNGAQKDGTTYASKLSTWQGALSSKAAKVTKAKRFFTTDTSSLVQVYPTTAQMKSQYGMPTSAADCTGYTSTSFTSLFNSYDGQVLAAGNYLISGDGGTVGSEKAVPKVILLDGNSDYVFFINETIDLVSGVFAVVNPSQDHHQYFIVASGKNLQLGHNNNESNHLEAGFMSLSRASSGSASDYTNYIKSATLSSAASSFDGIQKPTIQIYCMNNNHFTWTRGGIIEGYVGMFQTSYGSQTSQIELYNVDKTQNQFKFYGRVMATDIKNTSGDFEMPYCPAPNAHVTEEFTEVSSKYKVASLQYYYGDGTLPAGS